MNQSDSYEETQAGAFKLLARRPTRLAIIWLSWTVVGLFFTSQMLFMQFYTLTRFPNAKTLPFGKVIFLQMSICYLWALCTPLVVWLARRFCIERPNWVRRATFHLVVGLLLVGSMSAVHYLIYFPYLFSWGEFRFLGLFQYVFYNLDRQLSIYWIFVLMSHAINYYTSYRKGQLQAEQLRTQLVQSQLEALKMQVHPHFLFNTLHSISALLNKDTEAARRMITRLGDFLRLTLENAGTQEVTLQQEMEFLNGYLEIERVRFQDRLSTKVEVDPSVLEVRVPNLILQPIVENAMRHAIACNASAGKIEISATPRNGSVRIQVKDNGPGLPPGQDDLTQLGKGVGLANTEARLKRLYGSDHRFDLSNAPTGGLVVTLEIPRRLE